MSDESVGSVSVSVTPDGTGWSERLRAQILPGADELGAELGSRIGGAMSRQFADDIRDMRLRLDELGASDVSVRVRVDDNGSAAATAAKIGAVDAASNSSSGGVSLLGSHLLNMGALAIAGADIAIPALLAVGAAATGALAGVGVLALGFSGIGAALQAHGQQPAGGAGAPARKQASSGISQEQQQLTARQATQSAADQVTAAVQSQADAESGLAKAQRDALQAQKDLTAARVQAKQDIQDLNNSVKDNALAQQQAALTLAKAKSTLAIDLAAPGAGLAQYAPQIAAAKLAVAQAQQNSVELALTGTRLATQDAAANKAGVEGSQKVIDAKNKVTDSNVTLTKAQANLILANHKLAEAQQNVTDTALKNNLAMQQAAISAAGAAGGVNAFGAAMAKLNPIQQQFVDFLLSLKPLFDEVKLAASGFLPGLEQGIKDALPAFKPFLAIVTNVATAMGSVFTAIGKGLASPEGQKFLNFLSVELPKQITFLGTLFMDFGKIFAGVFQAAGPLIDATDKAITGFFNNLAKSSNGKGLSSFFDSLIPLVGPIGQALGAISGGLGKILTAITPALGPLLKLITSVATEIGNLAEPVLRPLAKAVGDLAVAVAPLIPLLSNILQTILPPLIKGLDTIITQGVGPLVTAIADALTPVLPVLGQAVTDLVAALAPFIVQVVQAIIPILPTFAKLLVDILKAVIPIIPQFGAFLQALTPLLKPLTDIITAFLQLVDKLLPVLVPLLVPVTLALGPMAKIAGALATALGWVVSAVQWVSKNWGNIWKGIGTALSSVYEYVLKPIFAQVSRVLNDIKNAMGTIGSLTSSLASAFGINSTAGSGVVFGFPAKGGNTVKGARAAGGPVQAGFPYTVNEAGQEIFVPKVDGRIIDNATVEKMFRGGGSGRAYTFNNYGVADPEGLTQRVVTRMAAKGV